MTNLKPLPDYKELQRKCDPFRASNAPQYWSSVKRLHRLWHQVDLDVPLASKGMNLQRGFVWTDAQKGELIKSICYGRPIPPIRIMAEIAKEQDAQGNWPEDKLLVIDGKQRLNAIWCYIHGKFAAPIGDNFYFYEDLNEDWKGCIDNWTILAQVLYEKVGKPFTDGDKIEWFCLINFAGSPQEAEHEAKLRG